MRKIIIIFFIILVTSNLGLANQDDFNVLYYEINLSIDPKSEIISGYVTVQAESKIDGLTVLSLDFYDNMKVDSIKGNTSSFNHIHNQLEITLNNEYAIHEKIEVQIYYHGHPDAGVSYAHPMIFQKIGSNTIICTESCPYYARSWWPCKDTPADKPDSVDIKITAPQDLTVASNGIRIGILDNDDDTKTHHWKVKNPIATYLITITISNYAESSDVYVTADGDSMDLIYFIFPQDSAKAVRYTKKVPNMIKILTKYYGEYPYLNEKYGMAEYIGDWAAMEYQTLSCFNSTYITNEETILHEIAHQWWGDCVSPQNFHHTWISEGFAVFSEAIYWGELKGQKEYHSHINSLSSAYSETQTLYVQDISTPYKVYPIIVYEKGAWVLHMLRHVVGDQIFWQCLKEYRQHHEYASATTEDFQVACEAVYGQSLEWFFHQWIYELAYPIYNYGWWQEEIEGGKYKVTGFIDRIRTNFTMPIDLTYQTADSESTKVAWVADSTTFFDITLNQPVNKIVLDEQNWVLKKQKQITTPIISYNHHSVYDSSGNKNNLAEPAEEVTIGIAFLNSGIPAHDVSLKLSTSDPVLQIIHANATVEVLAHNQIDTRKFTVQVMPDAGGHLAKLKIDITDSKGYSTRDSLYIKIGKPNVLLVDDDAGAKYEKYYDKPLASAHAYSANWEMSSHGCPGDLKDYSAVIWFTGDDRETTITTEEQRVIADYLEGGGCLLITGQNIGFDLVEDGTIEDSTFYTNYFHANYVSDSTTAKYMMGVQGDPITNGIYFLFDGAGNQTAPSAIESQDGAQLIFRWAPVNLGAGLRYEDPVLHYRVVYLAFGFEGLGDPNPDPNIDMRDQLMANIMNWFATPTGIDYRDVQNKPPQSFKISQNYPNPFNNSTQIDYQLPKAVFVEIEIFNLLGQRIRHLVSEYQQAGFYRASWLGYDDRGSKVTSGIYIYCLKADDFVKANKLLLLK